MIKIMMVGAGSLAAAILMESLPELLSTPALALAFYLIGVHLFCQEEEIALSEDVPFPLSRQDRQ